MNYSHLFFCILNIGTMQFCSSSIQQMGLLQEKEYKLWGIQYDKPLTYTMQNIQNFEQESEPDILNCQTKIFNCCLVCLASTPCLLYIASCFMD
jgi:hypothetical protein